MNALTRTICEPMIDAAEAAELLDLPKRTVLRLASKGKVPGVKIGNRWKFRPSVLNEWIISHMNTQKSEGR